MNGMLPVERVVAVRPKEVHMVLELQLEHEVLVDAVFRSRRAYTVPADECWIVKEL